MKKITRWLAVLGGSFIILSGPSARGQGFYFDASAGPALASDVDLKSFLTPTPGTELELDPGMRLRVGGGYNFNRYFSAGLETGFIYNEVDQVGGQGHFDASLSHFPMMANVILRYDKPEFNLVPYIGAGLGGDASTLSLDDVYAPNGAVVDGDDSTLVFAWQVFAGLRYRLNANMSLGAGYQFYSANAASWEVSHSAGDIRTGTARVHSFGINFNMKF